MARHAADKPRTSHTGARLTHYTEIEREDGGANPRTLELQRRERARGDAKRTSEYLRIERGKTA